MKKENRPRAVPEAPLAAGLAVFALFHVAAAFVLPEILWGAHHLRYVPLPFQAAWFVLLAALLLPRTRRALAALLERAAGPSARSGLVRAAALTALGALLFALLRSRNLFLGDGYLLSGILASGEPYEAGHAGYGTFLLARSLLGIFRGAGWDAGGVAPLALLSALSGLAVLLLAPRLAEEIASRPITRALVAGTILLSGAAVLFLGHVELYAPMHASVLLHLWLGARFLRGRSGIAAPSAALAVAAALHLTALAFAPSLLYLALAGPRLRKGAKAVFLAGLAAAVVLLGWYVLATKGTYEKEGALLPLAGGAEGPYSLFSPGHLGLVANVLVLLLGGALLLPLIGLRRGDRGRPGERGLLVRFFGLAALGGLLVSLLVDPQLGSRDWDLLALPVFPLLLLLVLRSAPSHPPSAPRTVLVLGAMLLHTAPWVAANADRDRSVPMTLAMVARDPRYDDPTLRASSSLALLLSEAGYAEQSVLLAGRAARAKGGAVDFCNLGKSYGVAGNYDEAIRCFRRALDMDPRFSDARLNLAVALRKKGDPGGAEAVLREWIAVAPAETEAYHLLGNILGEQGRLEETIEVFERCTAVDTADAGAWEKLGVVYARAGRREEGVRAALRAGRIRPDSRQARALLAVMEGEEDLSPR
ncbi:MAG: tetratricopeptide repeat protein [Candidatus Eisenbacteria bacterium]